MGLSVVGPVEGMVVVGFHIGQRDGDLMLLVELGLVKLMEEEISDESLEPLPLH